MPNLLADIRPDERRGALLAFVTLFGVLAGHTLLETGRDALFLAKVPADRLPFVYLAIALLALAVTRGRRPLVGGGHGLATWLVASASVTLGFWALSALEATWVLYALYVWAGLFGTVATLQFWLLLGQTYTVPQAKRLYGFIGAGSVLGAVSGASLASLVTSALPTRHVLLGAAVVFLTAALGAARLSLRTTTPRRAGRRVARPTHPGRSPREVLEYPYARRLVALVVVATLTVTFLDYLFKAEVSRTVSPEGLGSFFANFYVALNGLALVVQLVLTSRLIHLLGAHRALVILPGLLMLGAGGLLAGGALVAVLLAKGADGSLRHSLHRTSLEVLFIPLPERLRFHTKRLVDAAGHRGAQATASLLLLGLLAADAPLPVFAAAILLFAAGWLTLALRLRAPYLELFRARLREGSVAQLGDALPRLDGDSLEAVFAALGSEDPAQVRAAIDLLADQGKVRLIPAVLLHHDCPDVVLRLLELFAEAGRRDFVPIADRLARTAPPDLRAAALRARTAVAPDQLLLQRCRADESALVQATALVGLVAGGWMAGPTARAALGEVVRHGTAEARAALARAIGFQPHEIFHDALLALASDPALAVRREVARAMAAGPVERFLPALLPLLAHRDTRAPARDALVALGAPAVAFLGHALSDPALPLRVRRHVPRTLSRFDTRAAADLLLARLTDEPSGMVRYKILRGLGRMRAVSPELPLDRRVLAAAMDRTLELALQLATWHLVLTRGGQDDPSRRTPAHELIEGLLVDKSRHALERFFRLLGLTLPGEDFERIHRGLFHADRVVRASSRELLAHILEPPLRDRVLALVDEGGDEALLSRAGALERAETLGYEALLGEMLDHPSETLRCLAAYHVGELGLGRLGPRLEQMRPTLGAASARVVERALKLLAHPNGAWRMHEA